MNIQGQIRDTNLCDLPFLQSYVSKLLKPKSLTATLSPLLLYFLCFAQVNNCVPTFAKTKWIDTSGSA